VYREALETEDSLTVSVDEMTGIQALQRIAADLPLAPGKPQAREFEYTRHGAQTLIAAINVATGKVEGDCGDTRTEEDFVRFVKRRIENNPGRTTYHFIADQLNTHKSESLVRFIEIWFGILVKKVIKRGNFLSKEALKNNLLAFIDYFNDTMAKPFKWTYQGKVLTA
jgi:putative transposase